MKDDQVLDAPLIRLRPRAARHRDLALFEPCGERIERRTVGHFPAKEADALTAVRIHDDALLAVVHAERQARAAPVDALQAEQAGAVPAPVVERLGANADVSQSLDAHAVSF